MRSLLVAALLALGLPATAGAACPELLDHRFNSLQGKPLDLCQYTGQVLLVVNTASYCGNTPQYKGLEALYRRYRDRGLVVVGFPANDFGAQEPGTNKEIRDFCQFTYDVRFPMAEKTHVVGAAANPVFTLLAQRAGEAPEWNFHKYLVARDGRRVYSFAARSQPEGSELVSRLEALLAEKP